jgi:hypothetical protein
MSAFDIDCALLTEFETELDPRHLEKGPIPARVIGYGEISTVLEIGAAGTSAPAYKRVPIFRNEHEVNGYESLYRGYIQTLCDPIGIQVVPSDMARIIDERNNRVVVYIVQEKLSIDSIAHRAIHHLHSQDVNRLVLAILTELFKLFDFNQRNKGTLELGIDGQISNWGIVHFNPASAVLDEKINLLYIDTSTPLMRKDGKEQVDTELFLRSAPSFLVWLLRWFFIEDLKTRYYDFRKVTIDLIANFYKEQRPELIPGLLETVNGFFSAQIQAGEFKPLTIDEIQAYYREDAWIWRLYLAFRKVDRFLHNLVGKYYPYILPDTIRR